MEKTATKCLIMSFWTKWKIEKETNYYSFENNFNSFKQTTKFAFFVNSIYVSKDVVGLVNNLNNADIFSEILTSP